MKRILPVILYRDQYLDVICDENDKFLTIKETMPPMVNYYRLPMPTRADELEMRKMEWAELEAARYKDIQITPTAIIIKRP